MKVSCSCARDTASENLVKSIAKLGVTPIVTDQIVRAVYEGTDRKVGEELVHLFAREIDHDVFVHYDKNELASEHIPCALEYRQP